MTRFETAVQGATVALESGKAHAKLEQWVAASK
jgi:hypothetical protein